MSKHKSTFRILIYLLLLFSKVEAQENHESFQDQLFKSQNQSNLFQDDAFSTVGGYYYKKFTQDKKSESHQAIIGNVMVIDTRDQIECKIRIRQIQVSNPEFAIQFPNNDLCNYSKDAPFITITSYVNTNTTLSSRNLNFNPLNNEKDTYSTSRNITFILMGALGALWLMPGVVTNWDDDTKAKAKQNPFYEYKRNIRNGPTWDKDRAYFNFFLHPIAGATYYTAARHNGYGKWESFKFSFFMSTFIWEYGFEAIAEVPSIQDIIITPVVGSLLGELFYEWYNKVNENGGRVWNSVALGKLIRFFLNPAGEISTEINQVLDRPVFQSAYTELVIGTKPNSIENPNLGKSNYIGYQLNFKFNK